MANRSLPEKAARFFKYIYIKLFRINDNPQRIALGFGIGVFTGVLPGAGPIAALGLAFLLRVNRASALLGSILTNTWLSIPVFIFSLKAGAIITGVNRQALQGEWSLLIKDFHWRNLLDAGVYKVLNPILAGYAVVSLIIGVAAYTVIFVILKYLRRGRALQQEKGD